MKNIEKTIADMFLHAFVKISSLRVERNDCNAELESILPPVLPLGVYKMRPKEFFDILRMQKDRLPVTYGPEFILCPLKTNSKLSKDI